VTTKVSMSVNGDLVTEDVPLRTTLIDFVRQEAHLTGSHVGCTYEGRCGACTMVVDGHTVKSCLMFAVQAEGAEVTTVEALADMGDGLHPIQDAFWEKHGLQCGYCTPGMLMSTYELLKRVPDPSDEEIREALVGNICRCTGYQFIVESVRLAAQTLREMSSEQRDRCFPA
jgi:carbon-monoxide dehydrogenase small subunit